MGSNPPRLREAKLLAMADLFGIEAPTALLALERLVATGDISFENGRYRLSARLAQRQRHQDQSRRDLRQPWSGRWSMAIVDPEVRAAPDRTDLRKAMAELRYGWWRDGVWLRPDNLGLRYSPVLDARCTTWVADTPGGLDSRQLAAKLWDLDAWATRATALIASFSLTLQLADRFMVGTAAVRHLVTDPLLPDGLAPAGWPASALRREFATFAVDLQGELVSFLRG